jgi:putative ABC transport system substrate-binding protein
MKRLQLMKEALPDVAAATVFWDDGSADQWRATQSAAETMGLKLTGVELGNPPYDYENALVARAPTDHHRILMVLSSPVFFPDRERLAQLALRHRIASMFVFRGYVDAGGRASTRCTNAPPNTWIGLRRERIQPTCRWSNRPSSN